MAVDVAFKTNARQIEQQFRKTAKEISEAGTLTLSHVGRFGYQLATGISPYLSGALRKAITLKVGKDHFAITSAQPKNPLSFNRPYHLWMHGIGRYNTMHKIKSGTPNYMNATAGYLWTFFDKEMRFNLQSTIDKRWK